MSKRRLLELAGIDVSNMDDEQVPADVPAMPETDEESDGNKVKFNVGEQSFVLSFEDLFNLAKMAEDPSDLEASLSKFVAADKAEDELDQVKDVADEVESPEDDLGSEEDVSGDDMGDEGDHVDGEMDMSNDNPDEESDEDEDAEMDASDHSVMDDVKESVGENNSKLSSAADATSELYKEVNVDDGSVEDDVGQHNHEVVVPQYVKNALNAMITNHKQQAKYYDDVDEDYAHRGKAEFHHKVCEVAETVKEYLDKGCTKEATLFISSLMSELQNRFPAEVWKFLTTGKDQTKSLKTYYTEVKPKS